ncbi:hypothetical protein IU500_18645 [Nocardia terpenica]|uniref:endonuclease/exonuclease/phosphatase family protein n=1 Tax=Nocardia terpenica TaxID=455432 RepID=UPI0018948BCD|nr:endonuclease/exonuclease/phosphatase family protein [Nocardia terpenica]MBF6063506.1 hypothetical protein [Nocardia terpenica]MBF6106062.1 hypothetical protein [Nocardia terpenica]MBF6113353.1 hypothetical protein [Nocardia terpenica]MBF6119803.1 hypothetical protein [Nocardia terpenica]MBF6152214.1 hypothetical protein [Nocardia terpenica]
MMSYNLCDYGKQQARRPPIHDVIRAAAPDVLAIQEIWADGTTRGPRARQLVRELADATGLCCQMPDGQVTVAVGSRTHHVAVLWRPGLDPVRWNSWNTPLWHAMGSVVLDIGDNTLVTHASFHATPFGRAQRTCEIEQVVATMTRPPGTPGGFVGADWNCVLADMRLLRVDPMAPTPYPEDERTRYIRYDHDPFLRPPTGSFTPPQWSAEFIHQCQWESRDHYLPHERQHRWWADRSAGEVLAAGLPDTAVLVDHPWTATTGHGPDDPYPPRRFDAIRVTRDRAPAVCGFEVISSPTALDASDHLPVIATYLPSGSRTRR